MDLNDQLKADKLPSDLKDKAKPVSEEAKAQDETAPVRVYSVRELLNESNKRAREPMDLRGICPTGHYLLDEYTAGMRPGFTWVIAADTSVGKSSFIISVADEAIKSGKRVLIVSSEDAPSIYGDRLMARRAQVDADRLRKRKSTGDELRRMNEVAERAEDIPVYIEAGTRPIEKLEREVRAVMRLEGIDCVMWDYLQEFNSSRKHQDERVKFKHIAKVMRWLIKGEGKTGAILSQLTMSNDTKVPNKHNIRECRDVANGAEVIGILFQPDADIMGPSPGNSHDGRPLKGEVIYKAEQKYLLLDKNKDGPRGKKVPLAWNEASACFDTVKDPEQERLDSIAAQHDEEFGIPWDN